jgi:hypothetical protein
MRLGPIWLGLVLAAGSARAADPELRPPETKLELELEARERAPKVRVFWACFASDLGAAARAWLHARAADLECATDAALARDPGELQAELETAAGGRVLGDPRRGELRSLDATPGRERQLKANFCYSPSDVEQISAWTGRQLAALCESALPAPQD